MNIISCTGLFVPASSRPLKFRFPGEGLEYCYSVLPTQNSVYLSQINQLGGRIDIFLRNQVASLRLLPDGKPFPYHAQVGHEYKVMGEKMRSPSPLCAQGVCNTRKNPLENLVSFQEDLKKRSLKQSQGHGFKYSEDNENVG